MQEKAKRVLLLHSKESLRWLGLKLWNSLPEETKLAKSLEIFRKIIKSVTFDQCSCNLCGEYVHGVAQVKIYLIIVDSFYFCVNFFNKLVYTNIL